MADETAPAAAEEKKPEGERSEPKQSDASAERERGEAAPAKKNKKISKMTLAEIDKQLESATQAMGGVKSHYTKDLLARRATLVHAK